MENHSEQTVPIPTEPPEPTSQWKKLLKLIEDVFSKTYKGTHAIYRFLVDAFPELQKCWAAVLVLVVVSVLVSSGAVWWATKWAKNRTIGTLKTELQDTNVYYSAILQSTNSFYAGVVQQAKADNDKMEKAIQKNTTDYYEKLREKDTEITKLSNEKEGLETRVTMLQAIPDRINETASNAVEMVNKGLTNYQQGLALIDSIRSLTNDLAAFKGNVPVVAFINGVALTNSSVIILPADADISISLQNYGEVAANQTYLDFMTTLDTTNLISDGWEPQPISIFGTDKAAHRMWQANVSIEPSINGDVSNFNVATLRFATNAFTIPVHCRLSVFGQNVKPKVYQFFLCPTNYLKDFVGKVLK